MINRRTLRTKAVKALFAYENYIQANKKLAIEQINEDFDPDLNSMEPYDEARMSQMRREAIRAFNAMFAGRNASEDIEDLPLRSAQNALDAYSNNNSKDLNWLKKDLTNDIDRIVDMHYKILMMFVEWSKINKQFIEDKQNMYVLAGNQNVFRKVLHDSEVVKFIESHKGLKEQVTRKGIDWKEDEDQLYDWYKNILNKDEVFRESQNEEKVDFETDWDLMNHIARKIIFSNEVINTYFEEKDLNWSENRMIVRSLVLKTLKSIKESKGDFELAPISFNWDEDFEYFMELVTYTIQGSKAFDRTIEKYLRNWEIDRIALTDRVILRAALCEILEFTSIPVKVSINEFVEIAKSLSTPKSKNFVNGILDVMSQNLEKEGKIRKSGRGLIDNK
jgi:N utilization substance protein B